MIKPLKDRVVIKRDGEIKKINGIILPTRDKKGTGEVLAVGIECKELKIGDRVAFGVYAVGEYQPEGFEGEMLILREEEIMAVLDK